MTRQPDIPPKSTAIIDSSVLFAMGSPDNEKYSAFEEFVMGRGLTVKVSEQVAEELGEAPEAYAYQRERLQAAQNAGWLESGRIDFSNPRVSEVVDKTRERMATLSADGVTEDEIERTDTVLAGLAYQYATSGATHVTIFVSDRIAEQAIGDVLAAVDISDTTAVVEGRAFLEELVADQIG
jgi:hypothetical protein